MIAERTNLVLLITAHGNAPRDHSGAPIGHSVSDCDKIVLVLDDQKAVEFGSVLGSYS